jgi:hypothetical protein
MRLTGPPIDSFGDLADTTNASPFWQWVNGVGVAPIIAVYGVVCLVTQHAVLPSRFGLVHYEDLAATGLGSLYLSVALFLHLHCFWTTSPNYWATRNSAR